MRLTYLGLGSRRFNGGGCQTPLQKRELDVYRDSSPPVPHKKVAFLTNDGRVFEQKEIEEAFRKRASEMGADALVLLSPVKSIEAPHGWNLYDTFVYEAEVVLYR